MANPGGHDGDPDRHVGDPDRQQQEETHDGDPLATEDISWVRLTAHDQAHIHPDSR